MTKRIPSLDEFINESRVYEKKEDAWVNVDLKIDTLWTDPLGIQINKRSQKMAMPNGNNAILSYVQYDFKEGDKIDPSWANSTNAKPFVWIIDKNDKIVDTKKCFSMIGVKEFVDTYINESNNEKFTVDHFIKGDEVYLVKGDGQPIGMVVSVGNSNIKVKLHSGEEKSYKPTELHLGKEWHDYHKK